LPAIAGCGQATPVLNVGGNCPAKELDHRESVIRLIAHYGFAHAGIG
jgi:hypothetical protein